MALVLMRHPSTYVLDNKPWARALEAGTRISVFFDVGTIHATWYEGTIMEYNPITNSYLVLYDDGEQKDTETYGANKLWCLLKPIPVELSDDDSENETVGQTAAKAGASSVGWEIEPLD